MWPVADGLCLRARRSDAVVELHDACCRSKECEGMVPDYSLIETAFTLVQWALVAPLTVTRLPAAAAHDRRICSAGHLKRCCDAV